MASGQSSGPISSGGGYYGAPYSLWWKVTGGYFGPPHSLVYPVIGIVIISVLSMAVM